MPKTYARGNKNIQPKPSANLFGSSPSDGTSSKAFSTFTFKGWRQKETADDSNDERDDFDFKAKGKAQRKPLKQIDNNSYDFTFKSKSRDVKSKDEVFDNLFENVKKSDVQTQDPNFSTPYVSFDAMDSSSDPSEVGLFKSFTVKDESSQQKVSRKKSKASVTNSKSTRKRVVSKSKDLKSAGITSNIPQCETRLLSETLDYKIKFQDHSNENNPSPPKCPRMASPDYSSPSNVPKITPVSPMATTQSTETSENNSILETVQPKTATSFSHSPFMMALRSGKKDRPVISLATSTPVLGSRGFRNNSECLQDISYESSQVFYSPGPSVNSPDTSLSIPAVFVFSPKSGVEKVDEEVPTVDKLLGDVSLSEIKEVGSEHFSDSKGFSHSVAEVLCLPKTMPSNLEDGDVMVEAEDELDTKENATIEIEVKGPLKNARDDSDLARSHANSHSKRSSSSSDDFLDATPIKSHVTTHRTKKPLGGPARSIMSHIDWNWSTTTIPLEVTRGQVIQEIKGPVKQKIKRKSVSKENEEKTPLLAGQLGTEFGKTKVLSPDQGKPETTRNVFNNNSDMVGICDEDSNSSLELYPSLTSSISSQSMLCSTKSCEVRLKKLSQPTMFTDNLVVTPNKTVVDSVESEGAKASNETIESDQPLIRSDRLPTLSESQVDSTVLVVVNPDDDMTTLNSTLLEKPCTSATPTTKNNLSETAMLMEMAAKDGFDMESSLFFRKPTQPKQVKRKKPAKPDANEDEIEVKPGKNWRRSLSAQLFPGGATAWANRRSTIMRQSSIVFSKPPVVAPSRLNLAPSNSNLLARTQVPPINEQPFRSLSHSTPPGTFVSPQPPATLSTPSVPGHRPRRSARITTKLPPTLPEESEDGELESDSTQKNNDSLGLCELLSKKLEIYSPGPGMATPGMTPIITPGRSSFCIVPHQNSSPRVSQRDSGSTKRLFLTATPLSSTSSQISNVSSTSIADLSLLLEPEVSEQDKLLSKCNINEVVEFSKAFPINLLQSSIKVGEGAYGEVFLLGSVGSDRPVLKIVPVGGYIQVNGEEQTSLVEMLSEVVISTELSKLRDNDTNGTDGFVQVRKCLLVRGEYPEVLLDLWDEYDKQKVSENDRPDYLPVEQRYIALEFNNGGKDMEKFQFSNGMQAFAAWKQVVHTLAAAEFELEFEHRDLHWGNVLVKETKEKFVQFIVDGDVYQVETHGVMTTIIDFSLSRLFSREDDCIVYKNLRQDPTLFTAKGRDKGGDYQFDIYRKMRAENDNDWEAFCPKTNVFWLHYLLEKMTVPDGVHYKGRKTSKVHRSGVGHLNKYKKSLLDDYNSARDIVIREGNRID